MSNPQFSILIPTRNRYVTFRHTLESVARQTGSFEVVIADNCSSPALRLIAEEYANICPIKYVRSDTILPMSDNWENGLRHCSGDYVTVLGDDDALVPSSLELVRRIIYASQGAEVISWNLHTYWWPDTIAYWNANRLFVTFSGNQVNWQNSREMLKQFYSGRASFGNLPMIYNAFVHKSCIQKVIATCGQYFSPAKVGIALAPDVLSGIHNLRYTQQYVHSARPLAVRGNSGKSNGTAFWARAFGSEQRNITLQEERKDLSGITHSSLIPSPNLHIGIATMKLLCKEIYFPDDAELTVDIEQVLFQMVDSLNFEPESYEANLEDALALAEKIKIDISARIPPKQNKNRVLSQGLIGDQQTVSGVCVNCDAVGISNVADAAKLADAMMAPASAFLVGD